MKCMCECIQELIKSWKVWSSTGFRIYVLYNLYMCVCDWAANEAIQTSGCHPIYFVQAWVSSAWSGVATLPVPMAWV